MNVSSLKKDLPEEKRLEWKQTMHTHDWLPISEEQGAVW